MKKNSVKIYAKALAEIALAPKKSGERVSAAFGKAERFLAVLAKNGLQGKVMEIVALAEDIVLQKQGKKKITLETARPATASQKKLLHTIAKQGDVVKEKISPELIAGVRITVNGNKQFDLSLQKKLQKIF